MAIKIMDSFEPAGSGFKVADAKDIKYDTDNSVKEMLDALIDNDKKINVEMNSFRATVSAVPYIYYTDGTDNVTVDDNNVCLIDIGINKDINIPIYVRNSVRNNEILCEVILYVSDDDKTYTQQGKYSIMSKETVTFLKVGLSSTYGHRYYKVSVSNNIGNAAIAFKTKEEYEEYISSDDPGSEISIGRELKYDVFVNGMSASNSNLREYFDRLVILNNDNGITIPTRRASISSGHTGYINILYSFGYDNYVFNENDHVYIESVNSDSPFKTTASINNENFRIICSDSTDNFLNIPYVIAGENLQITNDFKMFFDEVTKNETKYLTCYVIITDQEINNTASDPYTILSCCKLEDTFSVDIFKDAGTIFKLNPTSEQLLAENLSLGTQYVISGIVKSTDTNILNFTNKNDLKVLLYYRITKVYVTQDNGKTKIEYNTELDENSDQLISINPATLSRYINATIKDIKSPKLVLNENAGIYDATIQIPIGDNLKHEITNIYQNPGVRLDSGKGCTICGFNAVISYVVKDVFEAYTFAEKSYLDNGILKYIVSTETDYICNDYTGDVTTIYYDGNNVKLLDPIIRLTPDSFENSNEKTISEFTYEVNNETTSQPVSKTVTTYANFGSSSKINMAITNGSSSLYDVIKTHELDLISKSYFIKDQDESSTSIMQEIFTRYAQTWGSTYLRNNTRSFTIEMFIKEDEFSTPDKVNFIFSANGSFNSDDIYVYIVNQTAVFSVLGQSIKVNIQKNVFQHLAFVFDHVLKSQTIGNNDTQDVINAKTGSTRDTDNEDYAKFSTMKIYLNGCVVAAKPLPDDTVTYDDNDKTYTSDYTLSLQRVLQNNTSSKIEFSPKYVFKNDTKSVAMISDTDDDGIRAQIYLRSFRVYGAALTGSQILYNFKKSIDSAWLSKITAREELSLPVIKFIRNICPYIEKGITDDQIKRIVEVFASEDKFGECIKTIRTALIKNKKEIIIDGHTITFGTSDSGATDKLGEVYYTDSSSKTSKLVSLENNVNVDIYNAIRAAATGTFHNTSHKKGTIATNFELMHTHLNDKNDYIPNFDSYAPKKVCANCTMVVSYNNKTIIYNDVDVYFQGTSTLANKIKNFQIRLYNPEDESCTYNEEDNKYNKYSSKKLKKSLSQIICGDESNLASFYNYGNVDEDFQKEDSSYTLKCDYMEHSHRNNTPTARYYQDFVLPSVIIANESRVLTSEESKNKLLNLIQFKENDNEGNNQTVAEFLKNSSQEDREIDEAFKKYTPARQLLVGNTENGLKHQYRDTISGIPCKVLYNDAGYASENLKDDADISKISNFRECGSYMFNVDKAGAQLGFDGVAIEKNGKKDDYAAISFEGAANSSSAAGTFVPLEAILVSQYVNTWQSTVNVKISNISVDPEANDDEMLNNVVSNTFIGIESYADLISHTGDKNNFNVFRISDGINNDEKTVFFRTYIEPNMDGKILDYKAIDYFIKYCTYDDANRKYTIDKNKNIEIGTRVGVQLEISIDSNYDIDIKYSNDLSFEQDNTVGDAFSNTVRGIVEDAKIDDTVSLSSEKFDRAELIQICRKMLYYNENYNENDPDSETNVFGDMGKWYYNVIKYIDPTLEVRYSYHDEEETIKDSNDEVVTLDNLNDTNSRYMYEKNYKKLVETINWVYNNHNNILEFKKDFASYFSLEYSMAYLLQMYAFVQIDNAGKNAMFDYWLNLSDNTSTVFYPRPYDMDSQMGLDNEGDDNKPISSEINYLMSPQTMKSGNNKYPAGIQIPDGQGVDNWMQTSGRYSERFQTYNTKFSYLWTTFALAFGAEIGEVYTILRNKGIYNADSISSFVDDMTYEKISAKQYNRDMTNKYLSIYNVIQSSSDGEFGSGESGSTDLSGKKVLISHGDRKSNYDTFLRKRLNFLDTFFKVAVGLNTSSRLRFNDKYTVGLRLSQPAYVRVAIGNGYVVTAYTDDYIDLNIQIGTGATNAEGTLHGQGLILEYTNANTNGIEEFDLTNAINLISLNISDNTKLKKLTPGNFRYLKKFKMTNVRDINQPISFQNSTGIEDIDVSNCPSLPNITLPTSQDNLKKLNIRNTSIKSLKLNNTNMASKDILISETLENIYISNSPNISFADKYMDAVVDLNISHINNLSNLKTLSIDDTANPNRLSKGLKDITLSGIAYLEAIAIKTAAIQSLKITSCDASILNGSHRINIDLGSCTNLISLNVDTSFDNANDFRIRLPKSNFKRLYLINNKKLSVITTEENLSNSSAGFCDFKGIFDYNGYSSDNKSSLRIENCDSLYHISNIKIVVCNNNAKIMKNQELRTITSSEFILREDSTNFDEGFYNNPKLWLITSKTPSNDADNALKPQYLATVDNISDIKNCLKAFHEAYMQSQKTNLPAQIDAIKCNDLTNLKSMSNIFMYNGYLIPYNLIELFKKFANSESLTNIGGFFDRTGNSDIVNFTGTKYNTDDPVYIPENVTHMTNLFDHTSGIEKINIYFKGTKVQEITGAFYGNSIVDIRLDRLNQQCDIESMERLFSNNGSIENIYSYLEVTNVDMDDVDKIPSDSKYSSISGEIKTISNEIFGSLVQISGKYYEKNDKNEICRNGKICVIENDHIKLDLVDTLFGDGNKIASIKQIFHGSKKIKCNILRNESNTRVSKVNSSEITDYSTLFGTSELRYMHNVSVKEYFKNLKCITNADLAFFDSSICPDMRDPIFGEWNIGDTDDRAINMRGCFARNNLNTIYSVGKLYFNDDGTNSAYIKEDSTLSFLSDTALLTNDEDIIIYIQRDTTIENKPISLYYKKKSGSKTKIDNDLPEALEDLHLKNVIIKIENIILYKILSNDSFITYGDEKKVSTATKSFRMVDEYTEGKISIRLDACFANRSDIFGKLPYDFFKKCNVLNVGMLRPISTLVYSYRGSGTDYVGLPGMFANTNIVSIISPISPTTTTDEISCIGNLIRDAANNTTIDLSMLFFKGSYVNENSAVSVYIDSNCETVGVESLKFDIGENSDIFGWLPDKRDNKHTILLHGMFFGNTKCEWCQCETREGLSSGIYTISNLDLMYAHNKFTIPENQSENELPLINSLIIPSKITSMRYMFYSTTDYSLMSESIFTGMNSLKYLQGMFAESSTVFHNTNNYISNKMFDDCRGNLNDISYMFANCAHLYGYIKNGRVEVCDDYNKPIVQLYAEKTYHKIIDILTDLKTQSKKYTNFNSINKYYKDNLDQDPIDIETIYDLGCLQSCSDLQDLDDVLMLSEECFVYNSGIVKQTNSRNDDIKKNNIYNHIVKFTNTKNDFPAYMWAIYKHFLKLNLGTLNSEDKTSISVSTETFENEYILTKYSNISTITDFIQQDLSKNWYYIVEKGLLADITGLQDCRYMFSGCINMYGNIPIDMFGILDKNNKLSNIKAIDSLFSGNINMAKTISLGKSTGDDTYKNGVIHSCLEWKNKDIDINMWGVYNKIVPPCAVIIDMDDGKEGLYNIDQCSVKIVLEEVDSAGEETVPGYYGQNIKIENKLYRVLIQFIKNDDETLHDYFIPYDWADNIQNITSARYLFATIGQSIRVSKSEQFIKYRETLSEISEEDLDDYGKANFVSTDKYLISLFKLSKNFKDTQLDNGDKYFDFCPDMISYSDDSNALITSNFTECFSKDGYVLHDKIFINNSSLEYLTGIFYGVRSLGPVYNTYESQICFSDTDENGTDNLLKRGTVLSDHFTTLLKKIKSLESAFAFANLGGVNNTFLNATNPYKSMNISKIFAFLNVQFNSAGRTDIFRITDDFTTSMFRSKWNKMYSAIDVSSSSFVDKYSTTMGRPELNKYAFLASGLSPYYTTSSNNNLILHKSTYESRTFVYDKNGLDEPMSYEPTSYINRLYDNRYGISYNPYEVVKSNFKNYKLSL